MWADEVEEVSCAEGQGLQGERSWAMFLRRFSVRQCQALFKQTLLPLRHLLAAWAKIKCTGRVPAQPRSVPLGAGSRNYELLLGWLGCLGLLLQSGLRT